jgi:hypothetical protein
MWCNVWLMLVQVFMQLMRWVASWWCLHLIASRSRTKHTPRVVQIDWTPLHLASQHGHLHVVKCLIDAGANIEVHDVIWFCVWFTIETHVHTHTHSMVGYHCTLRLETVMWMWRSVWLIPVQILKQSIRWVITMFEACMCACSVHERVAMFI